MWELLMPHAVKNLNEKPRLLPGVRQFVGDYLVSGPWARLLQHVFPSATKMHLVRHQPNGQMVLGEALAYWPCVMKTWYCNIKTADRWSDEHWPAKVFGQMVCVNWHPLEYQDPEFPSRIQCCTVVRWSMSFISNCRWFQCCCTEFIFVGTCVITHLHLHTLAS